MKTDAFLRVFSIIFIEENFQQKNSTRQIMLLGVDIVLFLNRFAAAVNQTVL